MVLVSRVSAQVETICHVSGLANALYLPYVIKYNSAVPETAIRYGAIAASLGLELRSKH